MKVDEQITKIYSQVIQACFIPFEESSVTEEMKDNIENQSN